MTAGRSRGIRCKAGVLSTTKDALELCTRDLPEVRIATIALRDIEAVECAPDLVSCSLRIVGRDNHTLFADGVLFGDAIHLIMQLGYSRVRSSQDAPQPDSITATSFDGRNRLTLTHDTLTHEGQVFWELPLTRITSIEADVAGAGSTLLFGTADDRACTTDMLQSSGTLRLLLALAETLREQPTTILDSSAIIQSEEDTSPTEGEHATPYPTDRVTRTMRLSRKNRGHAPRTRSGQH